MEKWRGPSPAETTAAGRKLNLWRWIGVAWTVILISISGWLTIGFPHPSDGDSVFYLPPMLNYEKSGHLFTTFYGVNYSPAQDGRFIWHGFLFQMVGSLLMPEPTYEGVSWAQFFLQAITLLSAGLLIFSDRPVDGMAAVVRLVLPMVLATWLQGFLGRPDLMVCTWTMLGTLWYCWAKNPRGKIVAAGVTIGLVAATSPLPALFLALIVLGVYAVKVHWPECLRLCATAAIVALLVFAATFLFYPFDFGQWLHGIIAQAQASEGARGEGLVGFIKSWMFNFACSQPMILFWCFPLFFIAGQALGQGRARWPVGLCCSLAGIVILIILIAPDIRNYNVSCLLPVFLIPWLNWTGEDSSRQPRAFRYRAWSWAAILAGLITAVPFMRDILIRPYVDTALSRRQALMLVNEIKKTHPILNITGALFTLFDDQTGLNIVQLDPDAHHANALKKDHGAALGDTLLVQQIDPYRANPPEIEHYRLIRSYFGNFTPFRIAGVVVANSPRGYNFAVYERISPDP